MYGPNRNRRLHPYISTSNACSNIQTELNNLIYTNRFDARRKTIEEQLKEEQDPDNQMILLKQKKQWDDLRFHINHLLGIVITK